MGCGCGKKKTTEQVLAAQQAAEARRRVLADRLAARRAEAAKARAK